MVAQIMHWIMHWIMYGMVAAGVLTALGGAVTVFLVWFSQHWGD